MTCAEIDQVFIEHAERRRRYSPEVAAHLEACTRCSELARLLDDDSLSRCLPGDDLEDRITTCLVQDLRPVRPMAPSSHYVLAIWAIAGSTLLFGISARPLGGFAAMSLAQAGALFAVFAMSVGLTAKSLADQLAPGRLHRIRPELAPALVLTMLTVAFAVTLPFERQRDFVANGLHCLVAGLRVAAVSALPLWLVLRRGGILSASITAASAGLLAGLAACAAVELRCSNIEAVHGLASHLGIAAICAGLGGAAGRAVSRRVFRM